jgi:hypothetical protein
LHFLIKVYDLHLLDSVFDLATLCDASMPRSHTYLKYHQKAFRGRMKKKAKYQMPWWGSYTLSDWVNHLSNLLFILQNSKHPDKKKLIKEWMIGNSVTTVLSCNHPRTRKSNKPYRNQDKGWIKITNLSKLQKNTLL